MNSAKITKDLAKANTIQDARKRRLKLESIASKANVRIPSSKAVDQAVKVKGKISSREKNAINRSNMSIEKALNKRTEALSAESNKILDQRNKFSDQYTMTDAERKDAKATDTGLSKIAASGAVLFGLIDPTARAGERLMKKAHQYNMEEDKLLFEYLYSPNGKEGK